MRSRQRTAAAADLSGCCLVNNITPEGVDVKSGEAVHFTLDVRPLWCYSSMRSAKQMPIWAWIKLRSYLRPVHFFVMSIMARHSIFSRLSSVGKTDGALVTLRSCRLKPSMASVVQISLHTSWGYLK